MLEHLPVSRPFVKSRIGNWCEESVLQESKLLEFVNKSRNGLLGFERANLRIMTSQQKVELSPILAFGKNIIIQNVATEGYLAVDVPENYPESVVDTDTFPLTTTRETRDPTARTCFRLIPLESYIIPGEDVPRYAQKFHIVVSEALVERPMYLCSEAKSFVSYAKKSKNQQAFLSFNKDNRSVWQFVYEEPRLRLESEGTPVEADTPVIIQHCLTGSCLGSIASDKTLIRNNFGVEWEVDCHKYRDHGTRREQPQNHWVIRVAGPGKA